MGEAEADAERAGCFAEQQLRLGLVVDGATPETRDRFGRPLERTTERFRTRIGAVHGDMGRGCTAPATGRAHLSPRGCGRPQERQSDRLQRRNIVSRLTVTGIWRHSVKFSLLVRRANFVLAFLVRY